MRNKNKMSLRSLFAQNLRQLSATKRSHAHVARALGINRQQFNNYITGKNLPNETVVDKICKYFNVDAAYMFRQETNNLFDDKILGLPTSHRRVIGKIANFEINNKNRALSDGLYYVYFLNSDTDSSIVCSLLAIKREGGISVFRRVTRIPRKSGPSSPFLSGFHYGFVTSVHNKVSLLGFDVLEDYSFSLLNGVSIVSSEILYGGIGLITNGANTRSIPFVIVSVKSGYTVKQALKGAKVYPIKSAELDLSVAEYLTRPEIRQASV
jgi:transcriptional regulator with XRE-family HTH domain